MSPAPPLALALACACAALLQPAPARAGLFNSGQCTSVIRGTETDNVLQLPARAIGAGDQTAEVIIYNNCRSGMYGQRVTVCDADAAPEVAPPAWPGYSPVAVARRGALQAPAAVYVYQYCAPL